MHENGARHEQSSRFEFIIIRNLRQFQAASSTFKGAGEAPLFIFLHRRRLLTSELTDAFLFIGFRRQTVLQTDRFLRSVCSERKNRI